MYWTYELQLDLYRTGISKACDMQMSFQCINKGKCFKNVLDVHYCNVKYMKNFQILEI